MTNVKRIRLRIGVVLLLGCSVLYVGCGIGAPFPTYDPPPTFAIHYTLNLNAVVYASDAFYTGSTLSGTYNLDMIGTQFITGGTTRSFGPSPVNFSSYYIVANGRWPGYWTVGAVAGCGSTHPPVELPVQTKIVELTCVVERGSMSVAPSNYTCTSPPSTLTATFDTSEIPSGTLAQIYFVDSAGTIYDEQYVTVNGSGQVTLTTPPLEKNTYTVAALFQGFSDYGGEATLTVNGPTFPCY